MKQAIESWDLLGGKEILTTCVLDDDRYLVFTDDTLAIIRSGRSYEDNRDEPELLPLTLNYSWQCDKLVEVGVITQDECDQWKARQAELHANTAAINERRERALLAQLQAKYGSG